MTPSGAPSVTGPGAGLSSLLFDPPPGSSPDDVLVYAGERTVTRAQLTASARALAAVLEQAGIGPGRAVGIRLPNSPEAVAAWFGTWAAGGVVQPLNPRYTDGEVEELVEAVGTALVITTASDAARLARLAPVVASDGDLGWTGATGPVSRPPTVDPAVALVQLTSGTTGRPKPVPLRHETVLRLMGTFLGSMRGSAPSAEGGDDPGAGSSQRRPMPNLVPVSLSLWAGIYTVLFAFRVGAPAVLMERFDAPTFAELVRRHEVRSVVLPPAALAMLCDDERVTDLGPLSLVRSITAPLSPVVARRFHERFGVAVLNGYGQTELGGEVVGWTAADWREWSATKLGAAGRPHRGVELRVVDPEAAEVEAGRPGELWVRTPATRYAPPGGALADRVDPEGWFRTGDVGHVDDDGFVWIDGRVSDMINRGGLKVFPADVEAVLHAAPGVRDAAVAGIADERLGEVPWAFVVAEPGTSPDPAALEAWCRARLAPYKVPVRYVAVDVLPRNEVGKVLRAELVGRHGAG